MTLGDGNSCDFNPSSGGTIASTPQALSEERTRENGDVKRVLVKFSTLTNWNAGVVRSVGAADGKTELRAERENSAI